MTMIEMILIVMVEPLHTIRYFPTISDGHKRPKNQFNVFPFNLGTRLPQRKPIMTFFVFAIVPLLHFVAFIFHFILLWIADGIDLLADLPYIAMGMIGQ
jgi:hypothetical protein